MLTRGFKDLFEQIKQTTLIMNRLISILITLFVIFLIYIWINSVMSKKSSPEIQSDRPTKTEVQDGDKKKQEDKSLKLSNYEDQKQTEKNTQAKKETDDSPGEKAVDSKNDKAPVESNPAPIAIPVNQKPVQKPIPPKKVGNAANMHLVIAGNFLQRANAESRLNELLQNGYKNAEIVNFDLSEYYTVIAGRFDDVIEARRIAKKVNDYLNIKAYVRVGKN